MILKLNSENLFTVLVGIIAGFIFMKLLAAYVHTKIQEKFHGKEKGFDDFDKVIEVRKLLFKKSEPHQQSDPKNTKASTPKELEEPNDPEYLKQKKILEIIYKFENKPKAQEDLKKFYLRLFNLNDHFIESELKANYRKIIQIYHPDKIDLKGFDLKTKKKLEKKINENFAVIQKAYEFLKN